MIKLIIFDWDGTLFDSIDGICKAMLEAGLLAGAPKRTKEDIKNIIGLGLSEAVNSVWPESSELVPNIIEHYRSVYVAQESEAPLAYEGVYETLQALKEDGYLLTVATGKSRRGLNRVLLSTGTKELFIDSRCADETLSKPDPLMLTELLESVSVEPNEAVMIGDTEYDLEMAANANIRSIGVSYGAHEVERLYKHNPVAIVDHFAEINNIIRGM